MAHWGSGFLWRPGHLRPPAPLSSWGARAPGCPDPTSSQSFSVAHQVWNLNSQSLLLFGFFCWSVNFHFQLRISIRIVNLAFQFSIDRRFNCWASRRSVGSTYFAENSNVRRHLLKLFHCTIFEETYISRHQQYEVKWWSFPKTSEKNIPRIMMKTLSQTNQ